MTKAQLEEASRIADLLSELHGNWIVYESQALTPDDAALFVGLGIAERERDGPAAKVVYTARTPYGEQVAAVIEARRIAASWPVEHQKLLAYADLESTEETRGLAQTPLFETRRSKGVVRIRRTAMGAAVHAWLTRL